MTDIRAERLDPSRAALDPGEESALQRLLDRHFGDGSVYLDGDHEMGEVERAVDLGLLSPDGVLTDDGWRFWRRRCR